MDILTFINIYYEYYIVLCVLIGIGAMMNESEQSPTNNPVVFLIVFLWGAVLWPLAITERFWKWID